jgi:hypothetical protein
MLRGATIDRRKISKVRRVKGGRFGIDQGRKLGELTSGKRQMEANFMLRSGANRLLSPARPAAPAFHTDNESFHDWGNPNPVRSADFFHLEE